MNWHSTCVYIPMFKSQNRAISFQCNSYQLNVKVDAMQPMQFFKRKWFNLEIFLLLCIGSWYNPVYNFFKNNLPFDQRYSKISVYTNTCFSYKLIWIFIIYLWQSIKLSVITKKRHYNQHIHNSPKITKVIKANINQYRASASLIT